MAMTPTLHPGIVCEGALKLAAIVRQHLLDAPWKQGFNQCREARGVLAVVTWYRDCQGKAAGVVGDREQVAAGAPDKAHYRVEYDAVTWVSRAEAFAQPLLKTLAAQRFGLAFRRQTESYRATDRCNSNSRHTRRWLT